jgi:hypothetical protein
LDEEEQIRKSQVVTRRKLLEEDAADGELEKRLKRSLLN